jgi:hypothetical protein
MTTIEVVSFDGTSLNAAGLVGHLLAPDAPFVRTVSPVMHRIAGKHPRFVRGDLNARTMVVRVQITTGVAVDQQDLLCQIFAKGKVAFLVITVNAVSRRVSCVVQEVRPYLQSVWDFEAVLLAPDPRWKSNAAQTEVRNLSASPTNFNVTNDGNVVEDEFKFTLKPRTQKAVTVTQPYVAEVVLANRVPRALVNYAIDVADTWDHAAEVSAARSQADGDDVRILVDGVEVSRWPGEGANTAFNKTQTQLWINLSLSPGPKAELLGNITAGAPADGGTLSVLEGTTDGFPDDGIVLVGSEAIRYRSKSSVAFLDITRGHRNTTAASHTAGDPVYWVERRVQIVYGNTVLGGPVANDHKKPILDLAVSTNTLHRWEAFINDDDPRSMQWSLENQARDSQFDRISGKDDVVDGEGSIVALGGVYYANPADSPHRPGNVFSRGFPVPLTQVEFDLATTSFDILGSIIGINESGAERDVYSSNVGVTGQVESLSDIIRLLFYTRLYTVQQAKPSSAQAANVTIAPSATRHMVWTVPPVLKANAKVEEIELQLASDNAAGNITAQVSVAVEFQDNPGVFANISGAVNATVSGTGLATYRFTIPSTMPALRPGDKLHIRCFNAGQTAPSSVLTWGGFRNITDASGDTDGGTRELSFKIKSGTFDIDPGVDGADTIRTSFDNVEVTIDSALVPFISRRARQDIYWIVSSLKNNTTGQTISFNLFCPIDDVIEVDVKEKRIQNLTEDVDIAYGVTFDDPEEWMTLEPGVNALTYTEIGIVSVDFVGTWRDEWC